jgi:hypothetical protein
VKLTKKFYETNQDIYEYVKAVRGTYDSVAIGLLFLKEKLARILLLCLFEHPVGMVNQGLLYHGLPYHYC